MVLQEYSSTFMTVYQTQKPCRMLYLLLYFSQPFLLQSSVDETQRSLSCADQNKLSIQRGPKCKTGNILHWAHTRRHSLLPILAMEGKPLPSDNLPQCAQTHLVNPQNASELQLKRNNASTLLSTQGTIRLLFGFAATDLTQVPIWKDVDQIWIFMISTT